MIAGVFREGHPRVGLILPGLAGDIELGFIVDTGFEGDLALPMHLVALLNASLIGSRHRALANGQQIQCPLYEIELTWEEEIRITEILVLEGDPLLGTVILQNNLLQIEINDGGEVLITSL